MVEKLRLNRRKRIPGRIIFILFFLPVYSLLLVYLGRIYNEYYQWSWISLLINIGYCLFGFSALELLNYLLLKKRIFLGKQQLLLTLLIFDLSAFFLLQSSILIVEQVYSTITIIITCTLNGMLTTLYVFIYYFSLTGLEKRISEPLAHDPQKLIKANWRGKTTFLSVDQFVYFETLNKITFGYTRDNNYLTINKSLTDLEEYLACGKFFRTNRQVIIQKADIQRVERLANNTMQVYLKSVDKSVIVSRSRVGMFTDSFLADS